ncbi:MAG: hypothetical protein PHT04_02755 [Eubacteriales bacterium]|nr:hypothetical protein [Eubacteriales bacterium]
MIVFATALKAEAEPLILRYHLKKDMSIHAFPVYRSDSTILIISGVGKLRSAIALSFLFGQEKLADADVLCVNLGFCGSSDPVCRPGKLVQAARITDMETGRDYYPDLLRSDRPPLVHLHCASKRIYRFSVADSDHSTALPVCYDMESAGFMESAIRFVTPDRILVLKIISDDLGSGEIDVDTIKQQLAEQLSACDALISVHQLMHQSLADPIGEADSTQAVLTANHLKLSESQKRQLKLLVRQYRLAGNDPIPDLLDVKKQKTTTKQERILIIESLKHKWSK